jgi:hypothetical protein
MRRALITALGTLGLMLGTGVGSARAESPWVLVHEQDQTIPAARSTCGFDVAEHIVSQAEEKRTVATYADGTPEVEIFRGDLTIRFTNVTTGTSVVRDLGGTGVFRYNPDGSPRSLTSLHGPFSATMPPGSTPTTGIIVFHRKGSSVTFNADGTRAYVLGRHDTPENLCQTLR